MRRRISEISNEQSHNPCLLLNMTVSFIYFPGSRTSRLQNASSPAQQLSSLPNSKKEDLNNTTHKSVAKLDNFLSKSVAKFRGQPKQCLWTEKGIRYQAHAGETSRKAAMNEGGNTSMIFVGFCGWILRPERPATRPFYI